MGSMYSKNENKLNYMFNVLKTKNVFTDPKVIKKLAKLITNDIDDFIDNFLIDFTIKDFSLNRFEILSLSKSDKKKIDNNLLYRYEYRKKSNLRTIFVMLNENNELLVLEAFNENGNKTKGKDSYDKAIKNAINNYQSLKGDN